MLTTLTPRRCIIFGDDLHDVAQFLKDSPRQWTMRQSRSNGASYDWDLNTGYAKAEELADIGWSEGAQNLAHMLGAIPPNEAEPEYTYDVAGMMPDVPLYCAGDPMHMRNDGHPQGRKPIVHLVVNAVAAGMIAARDYANYGTAITAAIGQIEATGRSVELDVVFADSLRGGTAVLGWKVKRAGDPVDLAAVAYSIGHPAAFRRLGFALIERTPREWETHGYGRCASMTEDLAHHINADGAFLLGGVGESYGSCRTLESAVKFAAQQINEAAGETLVEVRD